MGIFQIGGDSPVFIYDKPVFSREINWAHHLMNIQAAWATVTGKGVRVGIVDSGCDYNHDDLVDKIFGGINCTKEVGTGYMDTNGHGTSVASIIAAKRSGRGVAGVAPDATLFIAKAITGAGAGEAEYIKCAIESCITAGCDVVNLSIGSSDAHEDINEVIRDGVDKRIIFVAAAGNSGDLSIRDNDGNPLEDWPARLPYVISVAAINRSNEVPEWSSPGDIEFSAPGVDIITCYPGNKYSTFSGTSQAAPFVSGVCALLKECDPDIDFERAVDILSKHSVSIGRQNAYGAGVINVGSVVNAFSLFKSG
jgi:subtilisin family serine protease